MDNSHLPQPTSSNEEIDLHSTYMLDSTDASTVTASDAMPPHPVHKKGTTEARIASLSNDASTIVWPYEVKLHNRPEASSTYVNIIISFRSFQISSVWLLYVE